MKAILLIDHGSRRAEANEMLHCMANLVQHMAGSDVIVRPAHMELAEPTIAQGFSNCVAAGASEVIALPYMVSPGRHSIEHIPEMVADAARPHAGVSYRVTPAFGVHEKLAELILLRTGFTSGVPFARSTRENGTPDPGSTDGRWPLADGHAPMASDGCWHPHGRVGACGDACRARQAAEQDLFSTETR